MQFQIEVSKEVRDSLIKTFKTTRKSVWSALSYKENSDMCRRIRKAAIEKGGVRVVLLPQMETFHDADGYMRQYFPHDVLIEVSKNTGDADLMQRGEVQESWKNITIAQLGEIQRKAASLAGVTIK